MEFLTYFKSALDRSIVEPYLSERFGGRYQCFFWHLIDILEECIFDVFIAHNQTARLSSFAKSSPITSKIHPRGERLFRK